MVDPVLSICESTQVPCTPRYPEKRVGALIFLVASRRPVVFSQRDGNSNSNWISDIDWLDGAYLDFAVSFHSHVCTPNSCIQSASCFRELVPKECSPS